MLKYFPGALKTNHWEFWHHELILSGWRFALTPAELCSLTSAQNSASANTLLMQRP